MLNEHGALGCNGNLGLPCFPLDGFPSHYLSSEPIFSTVAMELKPEVSQRQGPGLQLMRGTDLHQCFYPLDDSVLRPATEMFDEMLPERDYLAQGAFYDPAVQMSLPNQSSLFMSVLHSMPHDNMHGSLPIGGPLTEVVAGHGGYMGEYEYAVNPVAASWRDKGDCDREVLKVVKKTEKQRRGKMSEKFIELRAMIPNSSKSDKASILSDAADYIKELLRTVGELKTLVRMKHKRREKQNDLRAEDDEVVVDMDSYCLKPAFDDKEVCFRDLLRSSWIRTRSKETSIDVCIIEDEVNIKITQRKKAGCLLTVTRALQELQLELLHLSCGKIGEHLIFMINTKIPERSIVHASLVAEKLLLEL